MSDREVASQLVRCIRNMVSMNKSLETLTSSASRLRSHGLEDVANSLEQTLPGLQKMIVGESQKVDQLSRRLERKRHR